MPDWFTYLVGKWRVIKEAPVTFLAIVLLVSTAIWYFMKFAYSERFARKDDLIASKDAQIELQDRKLADYQQKLDGASPDQAKDKIHDLERKVEEFRRFLKPRRLTDQQKSAISARIGSTDQKAAHVRIVYDSSCADCHGYAIDLAEAIGSAPGWVVRTSWVVSSFIKAVSGLVLIVRELSPPPPEAVLLVNALEAAGVSVEMLHHPKLAEDHRVELLVVTRLWP